MTATKPTKFEQTHIAMVLDRSGSMGVCRMETIEAVNKYLLEARQDANLKEADFELTIFDSQSIDTIRAGAPLSIADITVGDYEPRGGTPLYDAIGRGIDSLDGKLAASGSGKAILVIVTDGAENASRKYGHAAISELIKARQAAGWLIVFLGAGLDAAQQGTALGINAGTTASIAMDSASLQNVGSAIYSMNAGYASNQTSAEAKSWMKSGAANLTGATRKAMGDATGGADLLGKTQAKPMVPPAAKTGKTAKTPKTVEDSWDKAKADDAWVK